MTIAGVSKSHTMKVGPAVPARKEAVSYQLSAREEAVVRLMADS